jgi:hypothetical protein
MAGKVERSEIARRLGTSLPNVRRYCRDEGISLAVTYYPDDVREEVCRYYVKHGKVKTQKRFPNVKVRSIVERYNVYGRRQIRWTGPQLMDAARFAGIISLEAQAQYFKRPRAHAGSIRSLWMKRFGQSGGSLHGLKRQLAMQLMDGVRVTYHHSKAPLIRMPVDPVDAPWWLPRPKGERWRILPRQIYLWVDIERHLREDLAEEIKAGVRALARFQRWLYGTSRVRYKIRRLQRTLELPNAKRSQTKGRPGRRRLLHQVGDQNA